MYQVSRRQVQLVSSLKSFNSRQSVSLRLSVVSIWIKQGYLTDTKFVAISLAGLFKDLNYALTCFLAELTESEYMVTRSNLKCLYHPTYHVSN